MYLFALIPSPIVAPATWAPVAEALRRRGDDARVADLDREAGAGGPSWRRQARSAAALRALPDDPPPFLVAHSGAGALLPAIRQELGRPVAGYLFVDAGIPADGETRHGAGAFAAQLRDLYARGGRYPDWSEDDLRALVPDPAARRLIGPRPQPWAFWDEAIPVFAGWPDAPCGYLQFTASYDEHGERARREGWPYRRIDAGHFHPLVAPDEVADALRGLAARLRPAPAAA